MVVAQEREVCAGARLLPAQYLNMKAALMRDSVRRGYITRAEARGFFRLEGPRTLRVYDLLVACGWVNPTPPGLPSHLIGLPMPCNVLGIAPLQQHCTPCKALVCGILGAWEPT